MNKIYLLAIATILATVSLMATGIFTSTAVSQIPTTSGIDPAENTGPGVLPNGTVVNTTTINATAGGY
ncbi:hypothetical protein [Candidatus Nitrosocosmicus franklandus]|uniref:Uncharacterized protein n=1 Tax=Candidatus Nitrosocosmicus franklandianus TaxID=1798806 RepID=A0A484I7C4_9ARCH|nr:hypothetical protein [Candidatus Nitrosocosmicus franklandus]VFJ13638.1 exported protein of unknown function [Candidatus Nitrosocosmicus franklandus]